MSGLVRLTHAARDGFAAGPILFDVALIKRVRAWQADTTKAAVLLSDASYEYIVEESVDQVAQLLQAKGVT